ncbi:MAG: hypothetical protein GF346_06620 [Candidatus Eisenbacteria bacterium]|nr:hypothetical protein [Candidatus Latescibacterota bacterium]MBD3302101.1 hypothetical protein [Candidatus Eisenbacteria bacterium]
MLTRVEAYLDSQGVLRRWTARPPAEESEPAAAPAAFGDTAGCAHGCTEETGCRLVHREPEAR